MTTVHCYSALREVVRCGYNMQHTKTANKRNIKCTAELNCMQTYRESYATEFEASRTIYCKTANAFDTIKASILK